MNVKKFNDFDPQNESIVTVLVGIYAAYKLIKLISNILANRQRGKFMGELKRVLKTLASAKVRDEKDKEWREALAVSEFGE